MTPTQALGWAIVHSLWQGALAATALASLFAIVPVRAARTRYALAVATLLLMVAFPLATALRLRAASSAPSWTGDREAPASPVAPAQAPAPVASTLPGTSSVEATPATRREAAPAVRALPARAAARLRAALEPALPWVVVLWLGGVMVLSLRLASGWMAVRRLGAEGTQPVPPACAAALARLAARLRVSRPVRVLESAVVQVPAVIGWLRPVILLPASALTGLTPLQLDALLAHELAHVRRYDYVVNLLQSVIETLLFYHPAVWWVSRRVREEREHCCDDLAVAVCGDAHFYATALLSMERLRIATPALALAASGGSLTGRIRRLVLPAQAEIFPHWIAGVAVALALAMGGGAGLAGASGAAQKSDVQSTSGVAPAADDSLTHALLARVRSLKDADARRDAVEEIGRRGDPRATAALVAIARDDRDEHVQREAVASLGRLNDRAGLRPITEIARTHPSRKVRHEAIEAIREAAAPTDAIELLEEIALHDPERDVQQEAVEALGKLSDARAFPLLVDFARHHPVPDMRREAVKALGQLEGPDSLPAVLEELAQEGFDTEVQRDVVGALGDLRSPGALERLLRVARTHPSAAVRRKAIDNYAEAVAPEAALSFLRDVLAKDSAPEAQAEALEELAELPDDLGVPTLIDAAGMHPSRDVRAEAWRLLGRDSRARAGPEQAPQRP
jgi:beta-lactamase regulating signal transducer with metallopeptidase domain/HEAT repeat protein